MTKPEEEIGTIFVDAGLCWLGDPCYILGDNASNRVREWPDFCKSMDKENHNKNGFSLPLGRGLGIAVSTGYGDGEYPVYIRKNPEGRVAEVTIKFLSE